MQKLPLFSCILIRNEGKNRQRIAVGRCFAHVKSRQVRFFLFSVIFNRQMRSFSNSREIYILLYNNARSSRPLFFPSFLTKMHEKGAISAFSIENHIKNRETLSLSRSLSLSLALSLSLSLSLSLCLSLSLSLFSRSCDASVVLSAVRNKLLVRQRGFGGVPIRR